MFIEGLKMIENTSPNFNKSSTFSNKFNSEFKKNIFSQDENNSFNQKSLFEKRDNVSLHNLMIDLQKSSLSIQLAVQIRNKLVSAYKEIMNMPV
ncbi:Flagellar hook-basal body complex protein FliE [Buchnera aphidicola (Tetraneura ulmi)]|uniref:flagellar hook-basal body complex protein FliE n=1 Tax=Buchnera aphidicola TaxID=9 RepID=UPI003463DC8F